MLRQVFIYKDEEKIYESHFGKALDDASFANVIKNIEKDAFRTSGENIQYYDFYKYRISYITEPGKNIIFLFVSDLSDKFENIKKELAKAKREFLLMFEGVLDHRFDKKTFEIFYPTIEAIHKNMRPKISLVGFSGVGKTTITRLIRAEEIPTEHIPTITGDIATIKIGNLHFHLWDFAGQEQFSFLWNNFIKGSDAVLLITDSTLENVEKSKYFIELIGKEAPNAHTSVLGNKQDLPDALSIADIERILNMKAYSMVATDPDNRNKMITIIADILEMSSEVSPLLKPLIDRDLKVQAAEKSLESGDFANAVKLFEEVADLCLTLGDDVVSQEFHEKSQKIRKILSSLEAQGGGPVVVKTSTDIKPEIQQPPIQQPIIQQPIIQQPTIQQPTIQQPTIQQPTIQQPTIQKPTIQQPTIQQPNEQNRMQDALSKMTQMVQGPAKQSPPMPQMGGAQPQNNPQNQAEKQQSQTSNLNQLNQMLKGLSSMGGMSAPKINIQQSKGPEIQAPVYQQSQPNAPQQNQPVQQQAVDQQQIQPQQISSQQPANVQQNTSMNQHQISQTNTQIMDLRIKITNVKKLMTDLEMENIMGNIDDTTYQQKLSRLKSMEQSIQNQISDLEKMKNQ
jgi:small GTP-binding protein